MRALIVHCCASASVVHTDTAVPLLSAKTGWLQGLGPSLPPRGRTLLLRLQALYAGGLVIVADAGLVMHTTDILQCFGCKPIASRTVHSTRCFCDALFLESRSACV